MKRIAIISVILENPKQGSLKFNEVVSEFRGIIKGRMGIPLEEGIAVVCITVKATVDEINTLTGKLGKLDNVIVKTAISRKELD